MTAVNVAITIWWRAILFNAFLTGICTSFTTGPFFIIVIIVLLIGGFIFTLPLLPLINLLVKVQRSLPYTNRERCVWLNIVLLMVVWLFYAAFNFLTSAKGWSTEPIFYWAAISTSAASLIAVTTARKSLQQLNAGFDGERLINNENKSHV